MDIQLETICDWFKRTYNVEGNLLECINNEIYKNIEAPSTIQHRYIDEDVPFGLVPLESLGKLLDVDTSHISMIINLASLVRQKDYRKEGRIIEKAEFERLRSGVI